MAGAVEHKVLAQPVEPVVLVVVVMAQPQQQPLLLEEQLILEVEVVVEPKQLQRGFLAQQAAQASLFSSGPSPYRPQIPLHLPVHG